MQMNPKAKVRINILLGVIASASLLSFSASAFAVDAVAAKELARKDHCLRCHAIEKRKEGPSYHAIAYKYKGQADALDKLFTHLTSGQKVKLSDGHEEDHKVAKAKNDDEIKNLISWILTQ
jgi:cytochrome c